MTTPKTPDLSINLRSARKLDAAISQYLKENAVSTSINYNIYDTRNPLSVLDAHRADTVHAIGLAESLMTIRSSIRRAIQIKNSDMIDPLITKRKHLMDLVSFWKRLVSTANETDAAETTFVGQIDALRKNDRGYMHTVSVSTLNLDTVLSLNDKILDAKKTIDRLDDNLISLNAQESVVITGEDRELLEKLNLL